MSMLVRFAPSSGTLEQYNETVRKLEAEGDFPPDGLELHVCFGPEDQIRVSEVWSGKEQFEAFGERLRPVLADVGIDPGEPEVLEVHNVIVP